jgi:hypothetical protein
MIGQKLENVEFLKYLGSILTNDGKCIHEIKSRIAMAKAAFNKKKILFTSKLDLNLWKKLVKCYIWSMALYGAETWTILAADQKYLEGFEMWCGEVWSRLLPAVKLSYLKHGSLILYHCEVLPGRNEEPAFRPEGIVRAQCSGG